MLISITILPVICGFVLCLGYKMSCCDVFEELIIAVFTGCILAIPNIAFFLFKNNRIINNDLRIVLYKIKKNVENLQHIDKNSNVDLEKSIQALCDLHQKLEAILSENYLKDYDIINKVSENVLILITALRTILELSENDSTEDDELSFSIPNKTQTKFGQSKNCILKLIESLNYTI